MMKKSRINEKTFVMTAAIGSVLIMASLIVITFLASRQTISATNDAVSQVSSFYLEAMADRRAKTITNLIENNFDYMQKAIDIIEDENIKTQEELRDSIGMMKTLLSLSRFALVDEDNIVYTQYTTYTGGSRHEFLLQEKMDKRSISTVSIYGSSKQLCLAIPVHFKALGKNFKACFVQIDIKDIVDLLAFDDPGRTDYGLYSKSGENLSGTELGPVIGSHNLLDTLKKYVSDNAWHGIIDDFINDKEGSLTFVSDGAEESLSYVSVPEMGWELVVLIRESVIHDQIREISDKNLAISKFQIIFTLVLMFVFATILLLQLRKIAKNKLEAEKEHSRNLHSMANTDSMTGVRNKHAYLAKETELNAKIKGKEIDKLAVVVCDINGLKHVNDTLGHEAGDQLIKDASAMICDHFTHGSVFRTGGDEFVVLLQDRGYDEMPEVVEAFNQETEAHISENKVVVSIGYSTLTEGDKQLSDVFARADQMMYERKKELKSMGAKTRE